MWYGSVQSYYKFSFSPVTIFYLFTIFHLYLVIVGCFVSGLEYSADVEAEVVGKPEEAFFNSALERLNSSLPALVGTPLLREGKHCGII